MKNLQKILIILLIILPSFNVKAEESCGTYTYRPDKRLPDSYEGTDYRVYKKADGNVYVYYSGAEYYLYHNRSNATECPAYFSQYFVHNVGSNDYSFCVEGNCNIEEFFYRVYSRKREATSVPLEDSDRYKDITACRASDYKYIKECGCMPASITDLTSRLYMLIKIAAPALLLVIGGFDLIKAMSAQDEKAITKARQKLIKKFIAAAAIFLIFTLIQFIVSTLSNDASTTMKCIDYILNGYVA